MEPKINILISGDVKGNFEYFFKKVELINEKSGPFEMLLCVGEFFADKPNKELIPFLNGEKKVPLPVYILGTCDPLRTVYYNNLTDGIICPNITYLGKRGLYTFASGLKVAYLSGLELSNSDSSDRTKFNESDVIAVRNACIESQGSSGEYRGVDLLLTSQWPQGVNDKLQMVKPPKSAYISGLVREIRPRYHVCGLHGVFHEAPIFRIPGDDITSLELPSRFMALGYVIKSSKTTYLKGLSLTPVSRMRLTELVQKSTDEIVCPYQKLSILNVKTDQKAGSSSQQYFFDLNANKDENSSDNANQNKKRAHNTSVTIEKRLRTKPDFNVCWFCLASPAIERHLIVSVGVNFYLALAKGPINDTHVLITPVKHYQKSALLADDDWHELNKYKESLKNFFASRNEAACFFERNFKTSHFQINVVAVKTELSSKIRDTINSKCKEFNVQLHEITKINNSDDLPKQGPYFYIELPNGTTLITKEMKNFPLQFGRDIFCCKELLNCVEKVDWKNCPLTRNDESKIVKRLRESYKPYDFTQERK